MVESYCWHGFSFGATGNDGHEDDAEFHSTAFGDDSLQEQMFSVSTLIIRQRLFI